MGFSRQEYWSGLPFSSPGDLPDPGMDPNLACQEPPTPAGDAQSPTPHLGLFFITLSFRLHQGFDQRLLGSFLGHFLWLQEEKRQGL